MWSRGRGFSIITAAAFGALFGVGALAFIYSGNGDMSLVTSLKSTFAEQDESTVYRDSETTLTREKDFLASFFPRPSVLPTDATYPVLLGSFLRVPPSIGQLPMRDWGVDEEAIHADAAIAVEAPTGRVLFNKNGLQQRPMASTTKLAAALVAVETFSLDEIVTVSKHAITVEPSVAGFSAGETASVEEMLYALLLPSGNDAARALEEHYNNHRAGNGEDFVARMNAKAATLGLSMTRFAEPTGLSPQNVSTAYDIAQLLYAAMQNETLARIVATPAYTMRAENGTAVHTWRNSNKLLTQSLGVVGGKTGYTDEAGQTLVVSGTAPNGNSIVVVVMNASDRLREAAKLLTWARNAYIWVK